MIQRLVQALRLMLGSGEVIRTDFARHPATAQLHGLEGEILEAVPLVTPWGIAARPPGGARVLTAALGASRESVVALGGQHIDHPPPQLEEGEVALFAKGGAVLRLHLDGTIGITGTVHVSGAVHADEVLDVAGSLAALRAVFNAHTHIASGSPTSGPIPQA